MAGSTSPAIKCLNYIRPKRLYRFTDDDMENWRCLIQARRDWCAARGELLMYLSSPWTNKTLYPEHLPDWLDVGPGPSKLEHLTAYLTNKPRETDVVDLSAARCAKAKKYDRFIGGQTHIGTSSVRLFGRIEPLITGLDQPDACFSTLFKRIVFDWIE